MSVADEAPKSDKIIEKEGGENGEKILKNVDGIQSKIGDATYYDEVEIEDMEFDEEKGIYTYPCPCGDKFVISEEQLADGEEVAKCPSCTLIIRVIYNPEDFMDGDGDGEGNIDINIDNLSICA